MQDHARFNGFSQADLVGEQNARVAALERFYRDEDLMRQYRHARAHQTVGCRVRQLMAVIEYGTAQGKPALSVDQTGEQSIARCSELQKIIESRLGEDSFFPSICAASVIGQKTILYN